MSMFASACAALLLAGAAPISAIAQTPPPTIAVPADQPFVHTNSGLSIPATLADLPRTTIHELDAPQLDVMTNFESADRSEALTVYIYRATAGAVPVWFDRAIWAVENRPLYGTPTRLDIAPAFVPPGQSVASGMIGAWNVTGQYRGTALALLPVGEWLVKFRYSSATHDAAALEPRLRAVIAAIGWPGTIPTAPVAAPVAPCATPLVFKGEARPLKQGKDAAMMSALMGGFASVAAAAVAPDRPGAVWCRDAVEVPMGAGAVYRPGDASDAYLIALSDAGRGVWVAKGLSLPTEKRPRPSWSASLVLPGATAAFAPVDRLPAPADALAMLGTAPIARTTTWGKSRDISISNDARK